MEVEGAQSAYRLLDVLSELGDQSSGASLTSIARSRSASASEQVRR
jgi:hypothetical protein